MPTGQSYISTLQASEYQVARMRLFAISSMLSILVFAVLPLSAHAAFLVHHNNQEHVKDQREQYEVALLSLALEKSKDHAEQLQLKPVPNSYNRPRRLYAITHDTIENFIATHPYEPDVERSREIAVIPFPVFLGGLGYRVCLVSERAQQSFSKVKTLNDLKAFHHGFGNGWIDADIFRHNGLQATEIARYESIFRMVQTNRVDTFCRGANEVLAEYKNFSTKKPLLLDKHLVLYYDIPIFFITNRHNKELIERVTRGLHQAYADGSALRLWTEYFGESMVFSELEGRILVELDNPYIQSMPAEYKRYMLTLDNMIAISRGDAEVIDVENGQSQTR